MVAAGKRDRKIVIEGFTSTNDGYGGQVRTWSAHATEWAQVIFGTGQERREAAQERASVAATFRVPSNTKTRAVTPSAHRIQFEGTWDITNAVPLGRDGIELTAVKAP